jgi:hypothetical protein
MAALNHRAAVCREERKMTFRTYLLIAVFFAAILYLINLFFASNIVSWATTQQLRAQAAGQNAIGVIVTEPIIFVASNGPVGAIIGGLAWPAVIIWLIFIPLLLVIIEAVGVAIEVERQF